jgi:choline-sulfatase
MAQTKPNIVLIMVDQLSAPVPVVLRAPGRQDAEHRPAGEQDGVVFENFYSPSPLCAPARAAMMSGQFPSRNRVYDNAAEFASHDRQALPTISGLEGYRTCLSGKMHFVGPDQLHGFEERLTTDIYPADLAGRPTGANRTSASTGGITTCCRSSRLALQNRQTSLNMMMKWGSRRCRRIYDYARNPDQRPFCLVASFTHPHDPYAAAGARYWNHVFRRGGHRCAGNLGTAPVMTDMDPHSPAAVDGLRHG